MTRRFGTKSQSLTYYGRLITEERRSKRNALKKNSVFLDGQFTTEADQASRINGAGLQKRKGREEERGAGDRGEGEGGGEEQDRTTNLMTRK